MSPTLLVTPEGYVPSSTRKVVSHGAGHMRVAVVTAVW